MKVGVGAGLLPPQSCRRRQAPAAPPGGGTGSRAPAESDRTPHASRIRIPCSARFLAPLLPSSILMIGGSPCGRRTPGEGSFVPSGLSGATSSAGWIRLLKFVGIPDRRHLSTSTGRTRDSFRMHGGIGGDRPGFEEPAE